jgi:hypothetical protein
LAAQLLVVVAVLDITQAARDQTAVELVRVEHQTRRQRLVQLTLVVVAVVALIGVVGLGRRMAKMVVLALQLFATRKRRLRNGSLGASR